MFYQKSRFVGSILFLTLLIVGFQNCGKMTFKQNESIVTKASSDGGPVPPPIVPADEVEDPPIPGNEIPDPDGDDNDDDDQVVCEDRITDLSGKKAVSVNLNVKRITLALRPTKGILFADAPHLFRLFDLPNSSGNLDIFKLRTGISIKLPANFEPDPSRLNSAFFILEKTGNKIGWEDGSTQDLKTSPAFAVLKRDPFLRVKIHRKQAPDMVSNASYMLQLNPICLNQVVKYKHLGWLKVFGIHAESGLYLRHSAKKRAVLSRAP